MNIIAKKNRDIWEYPLNLTPTETKRIIRHLWELQNIEFDYYFFDENCSYRLLELLEVARPDIELTDEYILTAIPVDTVRSIKRAGLIQDVDYRPSQATQLNALMKTIPADLHHWVLKLEDDPQIAQMPIFKQLPEKQQWALADAAYRYLRFKQKDAARTADTAKKSHQLLKFNQ